MQIGSSIQKQFKFIAQTILLTCICCLIVNMNKNMKYTNNIGQKTGRSNTSKNVIKIEISVALSADNQNLNSGSLLSKGLNSCESCTGSTIPSSSGSICGDKKPISKFRIYIESPYVTIKKPILK